MRLGTLSHIYEAGNKVHCLGQKVLAPKMQLCQVVLKAQYGIYAARSAYIDDVCYTGLGFGYNGYQGALCTTCDLC
jgi:hypothetical protein